MKKSVKKEVENIENIIDIIENYKSNCTIDKVENIIDIYNGDHKVDWDNISIYQYIYQLKKLKMKKMKKSVKKSIKKDVKNIIENYKLNCTIDEFCTIDNFQDDVDWDHISQYQQLSEDFIREFKYRLNWDYIFRYQQLSEDFRSEFQDQICWGLKIKKNEVNWGSKILQILRVILSKK